MSGERNQVSISGGQFNGVTTVGQHNRVRVDSSQVGGAAGPDLAAELAALRELVHALREELASGPAEANRGRAQERADDLADELAEDEPDSGRVSRTWARLLELLNGLSVGADVVRKIGASITSLFPE
ncbi:hypothetical protein [Goodfellowiella coeruleoviolacea]|uniref:Uncharacterized protein n=1 Tax=Goodfellowiella coeruleoviolacea TaxID=334858 RepID=A0AAE3GCK3_9PSEU|nr:hypothetical protein [Goodfellowiella coeruleoviolacea]MCP2165610.1 hypothetical protein [Goodfellowiella coeruleoviolacea]